MARRDEVKHPRKKDRADLNKALGLCVRCNDVVAENTTMCAAHLKWERDRRAYRKRIGKCVRCDNKAVPGMSRCQYHRDMVNAQFREKWHSEGERERRKQAQAEKRAQARREGQITRERVCKYCPLEALDGHKVCQLHFELHKSIQRIEREVRS